MNGQNCVLRENMEVTDDLDYRRYQTAELFYYWQGNNKRVGLKNEGI